MVPKQFFKISIFVVKICILIRDFLLIFENYSMRMLSICRNMSKRFYRTLRYEERIFAHAQPVVNVKSFYM
jgi:hypothetical protein